MCVFYCFPLATLPPASPLLPKVAALQECHQAREKELGAKLASSEAAHRRAAQEMRDLLTSQHRIGTRSALPMYPWGKGGRREGGGGFFLLFGLGRGREDYETRNVWCLLLG